MHCFNEKSLLWLQIEALVEELSPSTEHHLLELVDNITFRKSMQADEIKIELPSQTSLAQTKCYHPQCPPGQEKVFGKIENTSTVWDLHYGYYSSPCKQNYFKDSSRDEPCQRCEGYFISNAQTIK